jgi:hypothetical protein
MAFGVKEKNKLINRRKRWRHKCCKDTKHKLHKLEKNYK